MALQKGVISEILGPVVFVHPLDEHDRINDKNSIACSLIGKKFRCGHPVVGDVVYYDLHSKAQKKADYQAVITKIDDRKTLIRRLEPGSRKARLLVANLDLLAVVASVGQPPLKPGLLDRYTACAHYNGIRAILVFNKWEMAQELDLLYFRLYEALGFQCFMVSAAQGLGIDALKKELKGHFGAFVGHSGVGKSSLLNRIFPDAQLNVGGLSVQSGRGKHTTTASRLLAFEQGGFVIDTPGIREFGLYGIKAAEVSSCFPEFDAFAQQCRFQPCTHTHEPDCAVLQALKDDLLPEFRYISYEKLYSELKASEDSQYQ